MDRYAMLTILGAIFILAMTALGGCWMVNVAPARDGQCMLWVPSQDGGRWVTAPCEKTK